MVARIRCSKGEGYLETQQDDVWQYIESDHRKWPTDENITPLYLTKRFVPGETSLIVHAEDADNFLDFLNRHILSLDCVAGVHIFNLIKPVFFPIPTGTCIDLKRFTVTINAVPARLNATYETICRIKPMRYFVVAYIAYTFQEHGSDIVVSLLAKSLSAAKQGVHEHIEPLEGVLDTNIVRVMRTKRLYSSKDEGKLRGTLYKSDEPLSLEMF